jgi:glycosyltransferase involved in cell wall biosynthesis
MRLLFLTTRRSKPSYRFRVRQVLPFLHERGHDCETVLLPGSFFDRMGLFKTAADYDAVVLQKRMLNRLELGVLFGFARKLVYDFDDAVLYDSDGCSNSRSVRRFKNVVSAADLVIAGNQYLAGEARRFSQRVTVVPTPIDTERYVPRLFESAAGNTGKLCRVGWTGSRATNRHLNELFPVLGQLQGRISVHILSDSTELLEFQRLRDVPVEFLHWTPDNEIEFPSRFDVGVMPLPDNRWTRGKCGLKALQYMALGIPAVCSPVGVNRKIITHGETGLLPDSPDEWLLWLTELADDPQRRHTLGLAGRRRVEAEYSLAKIGPQFVDAVEAAAEPGRRPAAA